LAKKEIEADDEEDEEDEADDSELEDDLEGFYREENIGISEQLENTIALHKPQIVQKFKDSGHTINLDQVFSISGLYAFLSCTCKDAMINNKNKKPKFKSNKSWIVDYCKTVRGEVADARKVWKQFKVSSLTKLNNVLWKKSMMKEPLEKVIKNAFDKITAKIILKSYSTIKSIATQLFNELEVKKSAMEQKEQSLQAERNILIETVNKLQLTEKILQEKKKEKYLSDLVTDFKHHILLAQKAVLQDLFEINYNCSQDYLLLWRSLKPKSPNKFKLLKGDLFLCTSIAEKQLIEFISLFEYELNKYLALLINDSFISKYRTQFIEEVYRTIEFLNGDRSRMSTLLKISFSVPKIKLEKYATDLTSIITSYYIKLRIRTAYTLWGLLPMFNEISKKHINSVKIDEYVSSSVSNMVGDLIKCFENFVQQHFDALLADYFEKLTIDIQTVQTSINQVLDKEVDTIELRDEYKIRINNSFVNMQQILFQIENQEKKYSELLSNYE